MILKVCVMYYIMKQLFKVPDLIWHWHGMRKKDEKLVTKQTRNINRYIL